MNPGQPYSEMYPPWNPSADPRTDLNRLLDLVKEYTAKVRELCDREAERKYEGARAVALALLVAALAGFALWVGKTDLVFAELSVLGLGLGLVFATLGALSALYRQTDDARELIHTVERLIEIASQYREHAGKRIDDKFEFDLRLNEADAVMRTYDRIMKRRLLP